MQPICRAPEPRSFQVSPDGEVKPFASIDATQLPGACPGGVGLTTALVALRSGWVIVGSLPTQDGTAATADSGCLLVLDSSGIARETIFGDGINGPWDMTALDRGNEVKLFVTNVLTARWQGRRSRRRGHCIATRSED